MHFFTCDVQNILTKDFYVSFTRVCGRLYHRSTEAHISFTTLAAFHGLIVFFGIIECTVLEVKGERRTN